MSPQTSRQPSIYSNTTAAPTPRPMYERHHPIHFADADGTVGATAYPINFDEVYNLKGRLLTLIDATFTDPEQRKAHKDVVWQTLRGWMEDIARAGETADATVEQLKVSQDRALTGQSR